jgi:hypothetical protein
LLLSRVKRFERSEAVERLEQLERTDPVVNGAKRLKGSNDWNWLSVSCESDLFTSKKRALSL